MRARIALSAALVVAALVGTSAQAGPGAHIADPAGDAITQQAGHDIVSVAVTSAREGRGRNATVKDFTITMTTAGPLQFGAGTVYAVEGTVEGCGTFRVKSYRSAFGSIWGPDVVADSGTFACVVDPHPVWGPLFTVNPTVKIDHDTISWTIRGSSIPRMIKPGTVFADLHGYVGLAEPGGGNSSAQYDRATAIDTTPAVSWRYGS